MKEIPARDARNQFGQLIDAAQRAPVRVTRKGRPGTVMMSEAQYERLRGAAWERLKATVDTMREEAEAAGLTEDALVSLLHES